MVRLDTQFRGGFKPGFNPVSLVRLHTNHAFAERCFYTRFYTERGLHTEIVLHRGMILQRDASTRRCSYMQMLSTQRCFCTPVLQDTNTFTRVICLVG